jgi:hypothetical protein
VIDLTAMVMGPYATQIMADMGADVIKVEPPEGDVTRYISVGPAPGMAGVFTMVIILGGIITGIFTATEAGAAAAVYALILTVFVYREIKLSDLPEILWECCLTNAVVIPLSVITYFGPVIVLTVTDNGGATNQSSQSVTVTKPAISLTVVGRSDATKQYMTLDWTGASGDSVDVYRNDAKLTVQFNDGHYTNSRAFTGSATYVYRVCQLRSSVCSNNATANFGTVPNKAPTASFTAIFCCSISSSIIMCPRSCPRVV